MAYSKGFFSANSVTAGNDKATTEDAASLVSAVEELIKRATQMMTVKTRIQNTVEAADCGNAIAQLQKCCQEISANAEINHSPRPY